MTRPDDWLDAFDPDAIDDPEAARLDDAVRRVLDGLEVAPTAVVTGPPGRAPWRPWRLAMGAALAAGVLIGLVLARARPEPVSAPVLPTPAPEQVVVAPTEPAPTTMPAPTRTTTFDTVPGPVRPAPRPMAPPRADGLIGHPGAEYAVADGTAVLSTGLLTFVRDAGHDPRVDGVRWADVPVVAKPVGTVFTAVAAPGVAALDVAEGRVDLELPDGTPLASLRTGLELTVVVDPGSPHGLRVLYTDHLPLDVVRSMVPAACACRPEAVIAAIAGLRFAGETPLVPPALEHP